MHAIRNPMPKAVRKIIRGSKLRAARRIVDPRNGDVWVWDASDATHADGAEALGVPYDKPPGLGDVLTEG